MLSFIKDMTFDEAVEIACRGSDPDNALGQVLIKYQHDFSQTVKGLESLVKRFKNQEYDTDLRTPDSVLDTYIAIMEKLPLWVLTTNVDWDNWVSAMLVLGSELYIETKNYVDNSTGDTDEDNKYLDFMRLRNEDLHRAISAILMLAEVGIGYRELLDASAKIVDELRLWKQSRPASMRLSNAYLQALGVLNNEE